MLALFLAIGVAFFVGTSLKNGVTYFIRSFEPPHIFGRIYRGEDRVLYYFVIAVFLGLSFRLGSAFFTVFGEQGGASLSGASRLVRDSVAAQIVIYAMALTMTLVSASLGYFSNISIEGRKSNTSLGNPFLFNLLGMLAELAKAGSDTLRMDAFVHDVLIASPLAKEIWRERVEDSIPFETYAQNYYTTFSAQRGLLRSALSILIESTKGTPNALQEAYLAKAGKLFGYSMPEFTRVRSAQTANTPLGILGCPPGASKEAIKQRYRMLVKQLHPDALLSQGMSEELKKQAEERFLRVQKAYESLMET